MQPACDPTANNGLSRADTSEIQTMRKPVRDATSRYAPICNDMTTGCLWIR